MSDFKVRSKLGGVPPELICAERFGIEISIKNADIYAKMGIGLLRI